MYGRVERVVVGDDDLASFGAAFQVHSGEESGEPVVVVQGPAVEGVVVALGALDARAQEHLGDVLGGLLRRQPFRRGVQVGRRRLEVAAGPNEQLGHEFIERPILHHLILDPGGIRIHRLGVPAILRCLVVRPDTEQLAPLHRPQVHELGPVEQGVDQPGSLPRVPVRQETVVLFARRRQADQVEIHPAQEGLVGADLRGGKVQLLELVKDKRIDEVLLRRVRPDELIIGRQHDHLGANGELAEAGEDEGRASPAALHHTVLADAGDRLVVAQVERQPGDVAHRAVRVFRQHNSRLRAALAGEDDLAREQLQANGDRCFAAVVRCPGLEPAQQGLVVVVVGVEEFAAGVGHGAGGLLQHQALLRHRQVHAPADQLPGQAVVVAGRVEAEQRQVEAILAAGGTVATAVVATVLHEHGHHVQPETDRPRPGRVLDQHRHFRLEAGVLDEQERAAVLLWGQRLAGDARQCRVSQQPFGGQRDIPGDALAIHDLDNEALAVVLPTEHHRRGEDLQCGLGLCPCWERKQDRPHQADRQP